MCGSDDHMMTLSEAAEIAQTHLDGVASGINGRSFEAFAARIALPFQVLTHSMHKVMATSDSLFEIYDAITRTLSHQGATHYFRVAKAVEIEPDGTLTVTNETNAVRGGQRLIPPFLGRVTLRKFGTGGWKETRAAYAITHSTWPILVPEVDTRPVYPDWETVNATRGDNHAQN